MPLKNPVIVSVTICVIIFLPCQIITIKKIKKPPEISYTWNTLYRPIKVFKNIVCLAMEQMSKGLLMYYHVFIFVYAFRLPAQDKQLMRTADT